MPACSVVVAFYNKLRELELVLAGLERQSFRDFEVIVADDGSRPEVVAGVEALMARSPLRIRHLWQEDRGFRKNRILNRAIVAADSEYLIFIDGDCIPHRHFVAAHWQQRRAGEFLTARRANLSEAFSARLTPEAVRRGVLERLWGPLTWDALRGRSERLEQAVYVPWRGLQAWINRKPRGLIGCNMSMWRADLEAIGGFDERYQAAGVGEDTDIEYRLKLAGRRLRSINNLAVQYHLYHRLLPRDPANDALFAEIRDRAEAWTPHGLSRHDG